MPYLLIVEHKKPKHFLFTLYKKKADAEKAKKFGDETYTGRVERSSQVIKVAEGQVYELRHD